MVTGNGKKVPLNGGRKREIGIETGKHGNGRRSFFPQWEKSGTGKRIFSRNGIGKTIFPFPVMPTGNPNGTSCFPVRRTGTLLVLYKSECVFVCLSPQNVRALP